MPKSQATPSPEHVRSLAVFALQDLGRQIEFVAFPLKGSGRCRWCCCWHRTWPKGCHAKIADLEATISGN